MASVVVRRTAGLITWVGACACACRRCLWREDAHCHHPRVVQESCKPVIFTADTTHSAVFRHGCMLWADTGSLMSVANAKHTVLNPVRGVLLSPPSSSLLSSLFFIRISVIIMPWSAAPNAAAKLCASRLCSQQVPLKRAAQRTWTSYQTVTVCSS